MAVYLIVLLAILVYSLWRLTRKPPNFPPGPPRLPILGSLLALKSQYCDRICVLHGYFKLIEKYGKMIGVYNGYQPVVVVSDYKLLKELFMMPELSYRPPARPFNENRIGYEKHDLRERLPGIIFADGDHWKHNRRFTLKTLRDFGFGKASLEKVINIEVQRLCTYMEARLNQAISTKHLLQIPIFNALLNMMASETLEMTDPKADQLIEAVVHVHGGSTASPISLFLPSRGMIKWPILRDWTGFSSLRDANKKTAAILKDYLNEHLATRDSSHDRDLIDVFLRENELNQDQSSPFFADRGISNAINVLYDLFIAGMDTSTSTIRWALLFLTHYPDVQEHVQQELDRVVGRERMPCFEDEAKLHFCQATIHEIHRLASIAYIGLPHYSMTDITINGFIIPKDTIVYGNLYYIMHDPSYWKDPDTFNPHRFIDSTTGKFMPDERVIPFGTGRRVCLGQSLAQKEIFLFITGLLQKFKIKMEGGKTPPPFDITATDPVNVIRLPPEFNIELELR